MDRAGKPTSGGSPPPGSTSRNGSGPFQISQAAPQPASLFCPRSAFSCINARFRIHRRRNLSRPARLLLILLLESACFRPITLIIYGGEIQRTVPHFLLTQSKHLPPAPLLFALCGAPHWKGFWQVSEKITPVFVQSAPLFSFGRGRWPNCPEKNLIFHLHYFLTRHLGYYNSRLSPASPPGVLKRVGMIA